MGVNPYSGYPTPGRVANKSVTVVPPKPGGQPSFYAAPYAPTQPKPPASPHTDPRAPGAGPAPGAGGGAVNPYGTESGNTYLEQRYLDRANGTDAAYNYAMKRGLDDVDNRMSAGGSFNSGARGQQLGDTASNIFAQSQGQLDSLAAGATGARQNKTDSMFRTGLGIAGGEAGTMTPYALGAGGAMSAADQAYISMMLNKAGVEGKARQGGVDSVLNLLKIG